MEGGFETVELKPFSVQANSLLIWFVPYVVIVQTSLFAMEAPVATALWPNCASGDTASEMTEAPQSSKSDRRKSRAAKTAVTRNSSVSAQEQPKVCMEQRMATLELQLQAKLDELETRMEAKVNRICRQMEAKDRGYADLMQRLEQIVAKDMHKLQERVEHLEKLFISKLEVGERHMRQMLERLNGFDDRFQSHVSSCAENLRSFNELQQMVGTLKTGRKEDSAASSCDVAIDIEERSPHRTLFSPEIFSLKCKDCGGTFEGTLPRSLCSWLCSDCMYQDYQDEW